MKEIDGQICFFPLSSTSDIACAWYVEMPHEVGNVLAMVFRDSAQDPWKMVLRTRFYRDDFVDARSKDDREGYMVVAKDPATGPDGFVFKVDALLSDMVRTFGGGTIHRIDYHVDTDDFMRIWADQPWQHLRVEQRPTTRH